MKKIVLLLSSVLMLVSATSVEVQAQELSGNLRSALTELKGNNSESATEVVTKGDLALFDLRGPVKHVVMLGLEDCGYVPEYSFDKKGKVTDYDRSVDLNSAGFIEKGFLPGDCFIGDNWAEQIERDNDGLVTEIVWELSTGGHKVYQKFKYDSKKMCTGCDITTTYDRKKDVITYQNLEIDKYGNWTKRKEISEGEEKLNERTITYWE